MSQPPKIDRKILKSPDEFVKSGTRILGVIAASRIKIVPALIAVAVVLLGLYAYDAWDDSQDQKSWVAYHDASKASGAEKWNKLKEVHTRWGSTRAGSLAAVNVADHAFDQAKEAVLKNTAETTSGEAAEWYGKALTFKNLEAMEKQLLLINKAQALELGKKWDEALNELKTAADMGGDNKALALLSAARIQELKGEPKLALEAYDKIAADFATSEFGKQARNQARRLKSSLFKDQTL